MEENKSIINTEELTKELNVLCDKYKVQLDVSIDFPLYKKLPPEVQLAMLVLQKHDVQWNIVYKEKS